MYSERDKHKDREVVVEGKGGFRQVIQAGPVQIVGDVPVALGGKDEGPTPYDLLLAALGTCTSMTITAVAAEKGWPVESVRVTLNHDRVYAIDCVECETKQGMLDRLRRDVEIVGPLTEEQRKALFEIANQCPVSRILTSEIWIDSHLKPAAT